MDVLKDLTGVAMRDFVALLTPDEEYQSSGPPV